MRRGNGLAGCGAVRDVNVAGLLRVTQLAPLIPVVADGRADGVLSEHCSIKPLATTWHVEERLKEERRT